MTFRVIPLYSRQPPRSALGKKIRDYMDSSDSELNSEDEVELLGDDWDVVPKDKLKWREPKSYGSSLG